MGVPNPPVAAGSRGEPGTPAGGPNPGAAPAPPAGTDAEDLERVAGWLARANRVTVLTGAGISTDSGIPDYRGPQASGPETPPRSGW